MINSCSYKYNPINQSLENASLNLTPQILIPFNNISKKGWCEYHKRWELVTIGPDNRLYFSCGLPLSSNIGLNKNWNKNQYEFIVDTDNLVIRVNERWSWIDVHDNQIYSTEKINSKIIDVYHGMISHPKNFDITILPSDINNKLLDLSLSLCKKMYGYNLHTENVSFKDFIKYPCCPEFSSIANRVDNIKNFNFRADINLFKDFCNLVQIKETKKLRKDFHRNPKSLFMHAMAQYIGLTNSDAVSNFVSNQTLYTIFVEEIELRFSIKHRCIYTPFTTVSNNYFLKGLRLWIQNARTDKSETVIVKRLIKFFRDTPFDVIKDAISVYYNNARNLPVAFHERILKEGFTNQMHDQLVQYFGVNENELNGGYTSDQEKVANKKIEYDDEVLRFEDFIENLSSSKIKKDYESIKRNRLMMLKAEKGQKTSLTEDNEHLESEDKNDEESENPNETPNIEEEVEDLFVYENNTNDDSQSIYGFNIGKDIMKKGPADSYYFALPRNTDELYEISTNMRNCVGYLYRNRVLTKKSIIVVMIYRNKIKACIELIKDSLNFRYSITQALGPRNNFINRRYCTAIEEWKKRHKIEGEIHYKL